MNCDQTLELIPCYMDGELDALSAREVEAHMSECEPCRRAAQAGRDLSKTIRESYPREVLPSGLRRKMTDVAAGRRSRPIWTWSYAFAAGLVVGVALMAVLWPRAAQSSPLAEQLVAEHIRSLMAGDSVDVASSDQHTVKPWFQGRLPFSPEVPDLAAQGFPLVGGRAEFVDGKAAAALVYHRRKHVIDVFVTLPSGTTPAVFDIRGYHGGRFTLKGLDYWVVSDVSPPDIEVFERAFRSAAGG